MVGLPVDLPLAWWACGWHGVPEPACVSSRTHRHLIPNPQACHPEQSRDLLLASWARL